jgi:hypothetical protein
MVPQMWMAECRMRCVHLDASGNGQITCVGNPGRHRFGQKPGRAGIQLDVWRGLRDFPFAFFARSPGFAK